MARPSTPSPCLGEASGWFLMDVQSGLLLPAAVLGCPCCPYAQTGIQAASGEPGHSSCKHRLRFVYVDSNWADVHCLSRLHPV